MKNYPMVYVAGKFSFEGDYSKKNPNVQENIRHAADVCTELWENGIVAVSPHLNSNFEKDIENGNKQVFSDGYLKLMLGCDALLVLGDFFESEGTKREIKYALILGMPIYFLCFGDLTQNEKNWLSELDIDFSYDLDDLYENKNNLVKYSVQFLTMREIQSAAYFLHVRKNMDYSPANIKGTGMVGLATRLWDKCIRFMNLMGFEIDINDVKYVGTKEPKNETISDNLIDIGNYGYIGEIYRQGKWGK